MASVVYNAFKVASAKAEIDLDGDTIWAALVMSNTTAGSENDDITNMDDFAALDECDGANYVRKKLTNKVVNQDNTNDRAEFDADDITWSDLGNGTRQIVGVVLYVDADDDGDPADDASNPVIAYIEFASPVNPGGGDFTVIWDAEGILQLA